MEAKTTRVRVNTMRELDALVGEHVAHEVPEVYWEDAHAVFRFETEQEALEAIERLKAQMNLPKVNWEAVTMKEIKSYRAYTADIATAWTVVEKLASPENDLRIRRDRGMWHAAFGRRRECAGLSAPVAICAAALLAVNIEAIFDPARLG